MEIRNMARAASISLSLQADEFSEEIVKQLHRIYSERLQTSQKFTLPAGGKIFNDGLKGLPENLKLPFPRITVEFEAGGAEGCDYEGCVILADQVGSEIHTVMVMRLRGEKQWRVYPYGVIFVYSKNQFQNPAPLDDICLDVYNSLAFEFIDIRTRTALQDEEKIRDASIHLRVPVISVLELLEGLSCNNVKTEATLPRKQNKNAIKSGVVPFDSYHVLMVNTAGGKAPGTSESFATGRQTREHLRRGHIHRYHTKNGIIKHWINNIVVNPGVGGKIIKDYKVK